MDIEKSLEVAPEETCKQMIEGLLDETRIGESIQEKVQLWLKEFKKTLKELKPGRIETASLGKYLKNIVPRQVDVASVGSEIVWKRPAYVTLIGSFASGCGVQGASLVDVLVEIPQDSLHRSDLLNHKYHIKRALYAVALADKLKKKSDNQVYIVHPNGRSIKPVLEVELPAFTARIHFAPPADFFKISRLLPDKNNLRFNQFYGTQLSESESCSEGTPHYNFSIAQDMFAKSNAEFLEQQLAFKSVQEAVMIFKIWLKQRSLLEGHGSFSGFLASMYMSYLHEKSLIDSSMTTYQILKSAFQHLSTSSWDTTGISFGSDSQILEQWIQNSEVVFIDSTGLQNFTCYMSKFTYHQIKREAAEAFKSLQSGNLLLFQATFMRRIPFLNSYDHILQLVDTSALEKEILSRPELRWAILNHSGNLHPVITSLLGSIIEKAISTRIDLIGIDLPPLHRSKFPSISSAPTKSPVRFGLIIKRSAALKQVEKCESEDAQVVAEFKEFWGQLSQLRRFRDGSMAEAVLFSGNKDRVCYEMLKYCLAHHLNVDLDSSVTNYLDLQVSSLFEPKFIQKPPEVVYAEIPKKKSKVEVTAVSVDEVMTSACSSFDRLSKALRQLEGLPLGINSVQCVSPVYRYAHPFPTPPQRFFLSEMLTEQRGSAALLKSHKVAGDKVPKLVEPLRVLVQLETTNKWPNDLRAVERLKCGLLTNIGKTLRSTYGLTVQAGSQYLDVLLDGFVFRIRLFYQRELIMVKEGKDSDGVIKLKDNLESYELEKEGIQLPKLTSTLHSFQHQFEPFGKVCRLAKRWLASHLMLEPGFNFKSRWGQGSSAFTEEAVELLVASLFLNHSPYGAPPNEAQTGFLRFLELLAHTDFKITPILVNFNEGLTAEEILIIERDFAKRRELYPALFIATPHDKKVSYWTKNLQKIILKRVSLLAETALKYIGNQLTGPFESEEDLRSSLGKVFASSRDHFDVIIWLKKGMNAKSYQNIQKHPVPELQYRKYDKSAEEFLPVVDFDPVRLYLEELRDNFGHLALFFHDEFGGDFVAVVWKPDALQAKDFSISSVKARKLTDNGERLEANVEGILESFQVLGSGLVDRVQTKADNWKS